MVEPDKALACVASLVFLAITVIVWKALSAISTTTSLVRALIAFSVAAITCEFVRRMFAKE